MGGFSFWHILVVGVLFMLLFGRGRFSETMGDVAKGIKSFKKGLADDDTPPAPPPQIGASPPTIIDAEKQSEKQG
jgi:sec-independent protein translocase protein TatA